MHEMALAESMLQICEDHARRSKANGIEKIWVEIGDLSHVQAEALAFCFEAVATGSFAEGALLEIERVAGRGWCHTCGKEVGMSSLVDACAECGEFSLQVTGGDQMRVKRMQVRS